MGNFGVKFVAFLILLFIKLPGIFTSAQDLDCYVAVPIVFVKADTWQDPSDGETIYFAPTDNCALARAYTLGGELDGFGFTAYVNVGTDQYTFTTGTDSFLSGPYTVTAVWEGVTVGTINGPITYVYPPCFSYLFYSTKHCLRF